MVDEFDLTFQYKGNRTYVHGTDIYNFAMKALRAKGINDIQNVRLSFHKLIRTDLKCRMIENSNAADASEACAILQFRFRHSEYSIYMFENGSKISGRYEYNEDQIGASATLSLNDRQITLKQYLNFSFIEKVVALNKYLLNEIFKAESGKWYFGKLELAKDFSEISPDTSLTVKLERSIGVKFTKSSIRGGNRSLGFIYFSMK